jgi:hypothetical protein
MALLGHPDLARQINRAIKSFFQRNRPFVTVTTDLEGEIQIHTNMDVHSERIQMVQQALDRLKSMC